MAGIAARIGGERGLDRYVGHHRVGYDIDCNWKVYVDNYLEGYPSRIVHPELNNDCSTTAATAPTPTVTTRSNSRQSAR